MFALKRLMNHHSGAGSDITLQYAQLSVEALREAAEKNAQFILRCVGEVESAGVIAFFKACNAS